MRCVLSCGKLLLLLLRSYFSRDAVGVDVLTASEGLTQTASTVPAVTK